MYKYQYQSAMSQQSEQQSRVLHGDSKMVCDKDTELLM